MCGKYAHTQCAFSNSSQTADSLSHTHLRYYLLVSGLTVPDGLLRCKIAHYRGEELLPTAIVTNLLFATITCVGPF